MPPAAQPSARSPLAGCAILIAAVLVLVFLVGFSVHVLFRQAGEIEKFTAKTPTPVPAAQVEGNEAAVATLKERLEAFQTAVTGDAAQPARIELTVDDLNYAIAISPVLQSLRGTFHVREIKDGKMTIDICYQMNGRPRLTRKDEPHLITWDMQYLVGTIHGHPQLDRRELVLKVDTLDVPNATVPEGFLEHFSTLRIFEAATKDPQIGPVMAALTRAELADGKLVLARIPGENPPQVVTEAEFQKGGQRVVFILGLGACVFLLFAGIMVVVALRKKKREAAAEAAQETDQPSGDA